MDKGGASLDWEAPALVLSATPFGEANALVHLLTAEHGVVHGLVRAGFARRNVATWQTGNLVRVHWRTRLAEQLATVSGETLAPYAAHALGTRLNLACLSSLCAVADGALPESEVFPGLFDDTANVLALFGASGETGVPLVMATLLRWEVVLLRDLGFGLDLSACAVTGQTENLVHVSPRTGRAVSCEGAGEWASRLLPLPRLFLDSSHEGNAAEWVDGLRLTGHFLARDVFGPFHRPLPAARVRLLDFVQSLAEPPDTASSGEES